MTNANLPERWLNDMRFRRKRLKDGAYRSYMQALMWSVANRTDGVIERGDVEDIPDFDPGDIAELMAGGLWQSRGRDRGWLIEDFATTQTGKDLLESAEKRRAADRARKARQAKEAAEAKLAALGDSTGNSGGKFPPDSPSTNQTRTDAFTGGTKKAVPLCTNVGCDAPAGFGTYGQFCRPCAESEPSPW